MIANSGRIFVLRRASEERVSALLEFHKKHAGEYLFPRNLAQFQKLVEDKCLYEVIEKSADTEEPVGICYIAQEATRDEFGGVFVRDDVRNLGVGRVLGCCAISNHYFFSPPPILIAHVHEMNEAPRRLLTVHLGFIQNGEETLPTEDAPLSMARNKAGDVVGHVFEFKRETLAQFADWIEQFTGTFEGKNSIVSALKIDLDIMSDRDKWVQLLRQVAADLQR